MDKDNSFSSGQADMDPNMPDRSQQHTVVLDEGAHASTSYSRVSPPKAVIDSSPLQSAMDKNKESLKVKLLVRRSFDQLVQQGIMPPLKTSPAIYEQRRQLERAKTGDLLKAKIKKRPDRVELEQRHILEHCDSNIDPSLAEKRRMLEKALLVDHLNSKISHRPGPLDLIGKNILHVEEPIERMVKEGLVDYALTFDESSVSVSTPTTVGEGEDSLSSEGESLHSVAVAFVSQPLPQPAHGGAILQQQIQLQPLQANPQPTLQQPQQEFFALKPTIPIVTNDGTVLAAIATPVVATVSTVATIATVGGATITTFADVPMEQGTSNTPSNCISSSTINSSSSTTSNLRPILPTPSANASGDQLVSRPALSMTSIPSEIKLLSAPSIPSGSGGGKDKSSKKKSKSKSITKAKPMKFHEYKGPPSAYKSSLASSTTSGHGVGSSSDNNYQLIMQQQTLLSYLEDICKKPTGGGIPSPGSREPGAQQGAIDGEDIPGSDLTPLDSPLSGTGGSSGGGGGGGGASGGIVSTTSRGKTSGASGGSGTASSSTTAVGGTEQALETLNKMKVSQLKKYCKQFNLAVSGTKSNLIERLKPFLKATDPTLSLPLSPASVSTTTGVGSTVDQELEDSLLAEQQKRIAELQLQLKKSQEELEQFRSLCSNQFVGPSAAVPVLAESSMVTNQMSAAPPPPPPMPTAAQLSAVLVGSPFSVSSGGATVGEQPGEPSVCGGGDHGVEEGSNLVEPPVSTTIPGLEESFFLEGLSAADSTTVDYGHDMEEMLHPKLTSGALPVERSPTHMTTLDKVLGQVQPTISSIAMNADPGGERNVVSTVTPRVSIGGGSTIVAGPSGPRAMVGDMHDLSLSLKSVNFDTATANGDDSMQQDTLMMNDFGDIDLVDFHMHSLDSDGPFPMLTNHDTDPTSTTDHHIPSLSQQQQQPTAHGPIGLFGTRDDSNRRELLSTEFVTQQQQQQQQQQPHHQHMHSELHQHHHHHHQHHQQQQSYVNNNDIIHSVGSDSTLRLDLLNHGDRQGGLTGSPIKQQNTLESLQQPHPQQQAQLHNQQQHSDTNNNSNYEVPNHHHSIGAFQFALQVPQSVASSSSSSSSSNSTSNNTSITSSGSNGSPGNCFKVATSSTNANLSKPTMLSNHHQSHHHHHQQQQQHHHHLHLQQQQQQHDQLSELTTPSSINVSSSSSSSNGTLIGDQIDSFQDNAMDFESLLPTDADTDSVLTANNCHRMVLDCAQDKPMFNYLPDNSLLDYFNEDCNGHDYEIKHLEY